MDVDTVFNPGFQKALLDEIHTCMALAAGMQSRLSEPDFIVKKPDGSPVTQGDLAVQMHLERFLSQVTPHWPFVGEENAVQWLASKEPLGETFWLCDPIDGTQDYISGGTEYAINLALVHKTEPVYGLIAGPGRGTIAHMPGPKEVSFFNGKNTISLPAPALRPLADATLIVGHGRQKDVLAFGETIGQPPGQVIHCASALKFHALVKNEAQAYVRIRETSEWDIAAGEAMVRALGGSAYEYDRKTEFRYGRHDTEFRLASIFITLGAH